MERWDQDAIDLLGPTFIEIGLRNDGSFRFIAVEGRMDVRHIESNGTHPPSSSRGMATTSATPNEMSNFLTNLASSWTTLATCRRS